VCGGVLVVYERVVRFESRWRRKQILALRRWLIQADAVLAVFATVLPWEWTAGVHALSGRVCRFCGFRSMTVASGSSAHG
jgi:hypothetical protein